MTKRAPPFIFDYWRAIRESDLPPNTRVVLFVLGTYADVTGSNAHPGNALIAAGAGLQPRAVQGHLRAAEHAGLIVRRSRGRNTGSGGRASVYDLTIPNRHVAAGCADGLNRHDGAGCGTALNRHADAGCDSAEISFGKVSTGNSQHLNRQIATSQPADDDISTGSHVHPKDSFKGSYEGQIEGSPSGPLTRWPDDDYDRLIADLERRAGRAVDWTNARERQVVEMLGDHVYERRGDVSRALEIAVGRLCAPF